jgi:hypothetical protein
MKAREIILSAFTLVFAAAFANAADIMYIDFDGVQGQPLPLTVTDKTGFFAFLRHIDPAGFLNYGPANPLVNTSGTSADFFNAGLYRLDPGIGDPLDLTGTTYTIEMFIYPRSLTQEALFRRSPASIIVDLRGNNTVNWAQSGEDKNELQLESEPNSVLPNQWYHVACVFDACDPTPMRLYLDGALVDSGGTADLNPDEAYPVAIGAIRREDGTIGQFYDGMIDELRLSGEALDPTEFLTRTPGVAMRPRPMDQADNVPTASVLTWRAGDWAASHEVYFGTDETAVADALPGSAEHVGTKALGQESYDPAGMDLGIRYYWRIDEVNEANPSGPWKGPVWGFKTAGAAYEPYPADGAGGVPIDAVLHWTTGEGAISHDIYFGTDEAAVAAATDPYSPPGQGRQEPNSIALPSFSLETTYYWRVDEVTAAKTIKGEVWSFSVGSYSIVDNFESYDPNQVGAGLWQDDGGAWSRITVEPQPHYRGDQAMEINYYNLFAFTYSEAVREFTIAQNWMPSIKTLVFHWAGRQTNIDEIFYVRLEDADGADAIVTIPLAPGDLQDETWHQFNAQLQDFADGGVNLAKVKKLGIGLGDRDGVEPSMAGGYVYIDEVRLYPSRCLTEYAPESDLDNDCDVDFEDYGALAVDWGDQDYTIPGTPPNAAQLLMWYEFEEGSGIQALDSSGNLRNGLIVASGGAAQWDADGHAGMCLSFDDDTAIIGPNDVFNTLTGELTISVWINGGFETEGRFNTVCHAGSGTTFIEAEVPNDDGSILWRAGSDLDVVRWTDFTAADWRAAWNHYGFVKDAAAGFMAIYANGIKVAEKLDAYGPLTGLAGAVFDIGALIEHNNDFIGKMDDFKIYGYALSAAEVVGAATGGTDLYVPVRAVGNIEQDQIVDYKDLKYVADQWLEQRLWP